jgi:hypothetical protein
LPKAPDLAPEVVLEDTGEARASLVARMVIAAPQTIISDLNALSEHLTFPIKLGNELRSHVGTLGDPSATNKLLELTDRLDPMTPAVIVWLLGPKVEARGFCAALTFVDAAHVRRAFGEFGREQTSQGGISERLDVQGNRLFIAAKGRTLLVANARETLRKGGPLAMETRTNSEQVAISFWPEVFAKGSGISTTMLAAFLNHRLDAIQASAGEKMTPALRRALATAMELLAQYFSETETISLFANVDTKAGIVLRGELNPRPSTPLAELAAHASPYGFDTSLPIHGDGTWLGTWGEGGIWKTELPKLVRTSGPGGERLARAWQKFYGEQVGNGSCTLELSGKPSSVCSFTLRNGASPRTVLDALKEFISAQNLWSAELDGRKALPLKVKRSKGIDSFEKKIDSMDPRIMKFLKAFWGGDLLRMQATVKDGKLFWLQSGQVTGSAEVFAKNQSQSTPPILTQTLIRTAGADFMFSIEPASLVLNLLPKVGSVKMAPYLGILTSLPGIESLHLPLVFSGRSGGILKGEMQVPLKGLESLSQVIRGVMGPVTQ